MDPCNADIARVDKKSTKNAYVASFYEQKTASSVRNAERELGAPKEIIWNILKELRCLFPCKNLTLQELIGNGKEEFSLLSMLMVKLAEQKVF